LGPDLVDWAGDSGHVVFLPASRDVADRRLICPSELIFRIYVKPCQEKYFAFSENKSGVLDASSPRRWDQVCSDDLRTTVAKKPGHRGELV
jgi:hypothetical protein